MAGATKNYTDESGALVRPCKTCLAVLPASSAYFYRTNKGRRLDVYCKKCTNARNGAYNRAHPTAPLLAGKRYKASPCSDWPGLYQCRRMQLITRYSLRPEDYLGHYNLQGCACAICETPFKTLWYESVDHCHVTGRVAGLLCRACNTAIGLLGESSERIVRAAKYVRVNKGIPR